MLFLQACAGGSYAPPPTKPGQPRPYRVNGRWYQPLPHARNFIQQGVASWYGRDFHGRKTSSGEIYNMHAMTAAHKTLPLGTYVRVQNLENSRTVDVRINDRGPFVRDRVIDLSYAAASRIGMVGPGTAIVRVEALGAPDPTRTEGQPARYVPMDYYSGNFTFQVGAFTERANAVRLVQKLDQIYKNAHTTTYRDGNRTYYRVRVGRATTLEDAMRYEQILVQNGYPDTFIVAE
jgi:rare lipoprotein A